MYFQNSLQLASVQFSSVAQSSLTLCKPMDCSTPGFPVYYQLPELTQTHVHQVGDAIQPSHPLLSPSPATGSFPISQFFASGGQSIGVSASAPVILVNIQDWFPLGWFNLLAVQWTLTLKRVFSNTTVQKHQFSLICGPVLLHLCDYWQNHSFNYMDLCWQRNTSAF